MNYPANSLHLNWRLFFCCSIEDHGCISTPLAPLGSVWPDRHQRSPCIAVHVLGRAPHGADDSVQGYLAKSGVLWSASWLAVMALIAPMVFLSIQGICTSPPMGSQVRPR